MQEPPVSRRAYWFDLVFGRLVPALFFSFFIIDKLLLVIESMRGFARRHTTVTDYVDPVLQALGLAYFGLIVFLYVVRLPKRAGDARPFTIAVSLFGSFSVLLIGFLPGVERRQWLEPLAAFLVLVGLCYTLWALIYLRRSFSIMPEARRLVTGGPYALSRHPLYLGEAVAAIGIGLPTMGWAGLALVMLFLGAQWVRMGIEERVLESEFPEYAAYRAGVPRYLPLTPP